MRPISFRFRLGSFLLGVAILSIVLAVIVPRFRPSSEAETRTIQIVAKYFASNYGGKPDLIEVKSRDASGWTVEVTSILNPEPGGYRTVYTFLVDDQARCHWVSLRAWGAY